MQRHHACHLIRLSLAAVYTVSGPATKTAWDCLSDAPDLQLSRAINGDSLNCHQYGVKVRDHYKRDIALGALLTKHPWSWVQKASEQVTAGIMLVHLHPQHQHLIVVPRCMTGLVAQAAIMHAALRHC